MAGLIRNLAPAKPLGAQSPAEIWDGAKPTVTHLRIFGCRVLVKTPDPTGKFEVRTWDGIYLGPASGEDGHRIYNPATSRVSVSRDVYFLEGKRRPEFYKSPLITSSTSEGRTDEEGDGKVHVPVPFKFDSSHKPPKKKTPTSFTSSSSTQTATQQVPSPARGDSGVPSPSGGGSPVPSPVGPSEDEGSPGTPLIDSRYIKKEDYHPLQESDSEEETSPSGSPNSTGGDTGTDSPNSPEDSEQQEDSPDPSDTIASRIGSRANRGRSDDHLQVGSLGCGQAGGRGERATTTTTTAAAPDSKRALKPRREPTRRPSRESEAGR